MVEPRLRPTRPPLRMVSAEAGVSTATVSYVDSGRMSRTSAISQVAAQRVRDAADRLGVGTFITADGGWFPVFKRQSCDVAFVDAASDTARTRRQIERLISHETQLVVCSEVLEPDGFDVSRCLTSSRKPHRSPTGYSASTEVIQPPHFS